MRRKRIALITLFLLMCLCVSTGLWLRTERRQYALNRQLIAAVVKGDNQQALALVEDGADPDTHYSPTPVPSLPALMKQLLQRSVVPANESPTALMIACGAYWNVENETIQAQRVRREDPRLMQALFTHGAQVNEAFADGVTPLIWAVVSHRRETSRLLLEHGARINVQTIYGWTALTYAVDYNTPEIIRLLLAHGANPNLATSNGLTPLKIAQGFRHPDDIALLKHYGARK